HSDCTDNSEEEDLDLDVSVVGQFGEPVVKEGASWKDIETAFSKLLIQIAMRQCWADVLGAYIDRNPTNMATIAVLFDHFELLEWIFRHHRERIDFKTWMGKFDCLSYSIRNRNVAMFQLLFDLAKLELWFTNIDPTATNSLAKPRFSTRNTTSAMGTHLNVTRSARLAKHGSSNACRNEARAVVAKMGSVPYDVLEICSASGDLEMFSYLWEHSPTMDDHWDAFSQDMMTTPPGGVSCAFTKFIESYDLQYLGQFCDERLISIDAIRYVARCRAMKIASTQTQWPLTLHEEKVRRRFLHNRIKHFLDRGYLDEVLEVMNLCKCDACISTTFDKDAVASLVRNGNLDGLQVLAKRGFDFDIPIMNITARHGKLDIVSWFHSLPSPFNICDRAAMDNAATFGHYRVVEWLHHHITEGCTVDALGNAAKNGFYRVVKFLNENRKERCLHLAVTDTGVNGHFRTLKYLFENVPGVRYPFALLKNVCDKSQSSRNALDVVEYLTTNYLDVLEPGELDMVYRYVCCYSEEVSDFLKERELKFRGQKSGELKFRGFVGETNDDDVEFRRTWDQHYANLISS
ncbi:hypothetical protein HDU76_003342, partial [Blyttiomyces sp. JEL0837]